MSALPEPATSLESKRYQQLRHLSQVISIALFFAGLCVAVWIGPGVNQLVESLFGSNRWVRLCALGFVYAAGFELISLPVDFWSSYLLEHRFRLSNQTLGNWWWKRIKLYLVGGPIGLLLLVGGYTFLWYTGSWWWLAAAAGWLLCTLVLGRIVPTLILPLFYKITPIDDSTLLERFRRLAEGTGLSVQGVFRLGLSEETKKANAALAGLGKSRRVLLGDTLLEEFSPAEIDVVFAHEVGHHVHKHLWKFLVMDVTLTAVACFLADRALHLLARPLGYPGPMDPATLPLFLTCLGLFGLVMLPVRNAVSRWFERQADRYALARTGNPAAFHSAFTRLAELNKVDTDPNPVMVLLLHDHPPIRARLALANIGASDPDPSPARHVAPPFS